MTALIPVEPSALEALFEAAAAQIEIRARNLPAGRLARAEGSENPTLRVYLAGVNPFIEYLTERKQLPSKELIDAFLAERLNHVTTTTQRKYLTPIREFCRHLSALITRHALTAPEEQRDTLRGIAALVAECVAYPDPKTEQTTYEAPVLRQDRRKAGKAGVWLSLEQVSEMLSKVDRSTLLGLRDYTLMLAGFNTALRAAELARLTLDAFQLMPAGEDYFIRVRGKGNNVTPVPCPAHVYAAVQAWVEAFNLRLMEGDGRRIEEHDVVWRGFLKNGAIPHNRNTLTTRAIQNVIRARGEAAGIQNLSPHDLRRTAALLGLVHGMTTEEVQAMLRHADTKTTMRYIAGWEHFKKGKTLTDVGVKIK